MTRQSIIALAALAVLVAQAQSPTSTPPALRRRSTPDPQEATPYPATVGGKPRAQWKRERRGRR